MDPQWLAAWRDDLDGRLRPFVAGFERAHGYAPGDNRIVAATSGESGAALPDSLAGFYRVIEEVSLPDVGNGYFIHSADHDFSGGVFASDGGGILFAVRADGTVWRSVTASQDGDFEPVAEDLEDFLDQLRRAVIRFIETGEPGSL
ncbi:hypothetical protein GCM10010435_08500 [Winogradskya consettensis]|uniref:Uncharacterized protein n=1 Tax=Winogradskya consettensis TaxID=113560 RepID=A0A919SXB7_9ACTN|nr:hypothetical protein [Actinoplanes consettensis]GIM80535.1 hypothetical protein Aco04nite_71220 [Actinoplanes consettensis]